MPSAFSCVFSACGCSADAVDATATDASAPKKSVERLHSEKTGQDALEQFADEADDNAGAKVLIKYFEVSM